MDAKLSLLVLLVVCLQSTQVNGGRCGKKKQCCPQISNVVQYPLCPGSEADPTDLTPPILYLNFTESSEGVELMNNATRNESGLIFNDKNKQYALLNESLRTNATCILYPSECPKGFTVSMLVDIRECLVNKDGGYGKTMGILTTVDSGIFRQTKEGLNLRCKDKKLYLNIFTDERKYSVEGIKILDTPAKTRMTFVFVEGYETSLYYNGKKKEGTFTKWFIPEYKLTQGNYAVGIGQYKPHSADLTLKGTFADLMVWNRTLTDKEVQAIGTTDQY